MMSVEAGEVLFSASIFCVQAELPRMHAQCGTGISIGDGCSKQPFCVCDLKW